jgi:uncharacterized protein
MGRPVVHFEIAGAEPERLQDYYAELFGWTYDVTDASTETVSQPGRYGFITAETNDDGTGVHGINGGVAGGEGHRPRVIFYIQVEDVETALEQAEHLGGNRVMGPEGTPGGLIVGWFTDPEGNQVGVAGPK